MCAAVQAHHHRPPIIVAHHQGHDHHQRYAVTSCQLSVASNQSSNQSQSPESSARPRCCTIAAASPVVAAPAAAPPPAGCFVGQHRHTPTYIALHTFHAHQKEKGNNGPVQPAGWRRNGRKRGAQYHILRTSRICDALQKPHKTPSAQGTSAWC